MSEIDVFDGYPDYTIIAWALGHKAVYYVTFGSYQGEWLMMSRNENNYYIWKDYYGSCSGCDNLQASLDYRNPTRSSALEFAKDYQPFVEIPHDTMKNIVGAGKLLEIIPANIRDDIGEINFSESVIDMMLAVKLEEGMNFPSQEIITCRNAELRRRALSVKTYEKFMEEMGTEVVHEEGPNQLLKAGDTQFVHLQDSSTPRRYLLRVPPTVNTVREAVAWTFNLSEDTYYPLIET